MRYTKYYILLETKSEWKKIEEVCKEKFDQKEYDTLPKPLKKGKYKGYFPLAVESHFVNVDIDVPKYLKGLGYKLFDPQQIKNWYDNDE